LTYAAVEELAVLDLEALARNERVLRLLHNGANKPELLGNKLRLADVVGGPLGGTPVHGLALLRDDVVHRAHCLLERRVRVAAVQVQDVDVLELETVEARLSALDDVLAGAADVVGLAKERTKQVILMA